MIRKYIISLVHTQRKISGELITETAIYEIKIPQQPDYLASDCNIHIVTINNETGEVRTDEYYTYARKAARVIRSVLQNGGKLWRVEKIED